MAWWQKKLLRFALARTGLLDDKALDLDGLDMTWGRKNVVELKNVGLNIAHISKLIQLPPALRVDAARVLVLRLTVPADIYQSSIVAELDGVEVGVKLDDVGDVRPGARPATQRPRSAARKPPHRKVPRRIRSPSPHDPGGLSDSGEAHLPTAEELAESFLLEEPAEERRELEASVVMRHAKLDQSVMSESSDGADSGTGVSMGLPGFLAGFLQGIVDRLQILVQNVEVRLDAFVSGEDEIRMPVTLKLRLGSIESSSKSSEGSLPEAADPSDSDHQIRLRDINIEVVTESSFLEQLSVPSPSPSPSQSRTNTRSPSWSESTHPSQTRYTHSEPVMPRARPASSTISNIRSTGHFRGASIIKGSLQGSVTHDGAGDADQERPDHSDLDIKAGDDNISWGSRRSKTSLPVDDLWKSTVDEDELPDSLLLDRAPTPRAHSLGSASPAFSRAQSETSNHSRMARSLGAEPKHHQLSQHQPRLYDSGVRPGASTRLPSVADSSAQGMPLGTESETDNKLAGLASSALGIEVNSSSEDVPSSPEDDLETSRIFSHGEAQSMYMSAMSQPESTHMPGGWSSSSQSDNSQTLEEIRQVLAARPTAATGDTQFQEDRQSSEPAHLTISGNVTPRAQPPEATFVKPTKFDAPSHVSLRLLSVDSVLITLPRSDPTAGDEPSLSSPPSMSSNARSMQFDMPGAFSTYSHLAASQRGSLDPSASMRGSFVRDKSDIHEASSSTTPLDVQVGTVNVRLDMSSIRLLIKLSLLTKSALRGEDTVPKQPTATMQDGQEGVRTRVTIQRVDVAVGHGPSSHPETAAGNVGDNLLTLDCREMGLNLSQHETTLRLGRLEAFVGACQLLRFQRQEDVDNSTSFTTDLPDVYVLSRRQDATLRTGAVAYIEAQIIPMTLMIDLPAIDAAFDRFGGLGALIDIGGSLLSESGIRGSSSSPPMSPKGVRFSDEADADDPEIELKMDLVLGSLTVMLKTEKCDIEVQASKIKAIYRQHGMSGASSNQIVITGPQPLNRDMEPITIRLTSTRVEYASSPQDKDLERLLALLTPSKDKYDNDDDILVDTLLRQRRKGAVARVYVGSAEVICDDLNCLESVSGMAKDLDRLSAVAKYLPEDERPGILLMVRVNDFAASLPVNPRFGQLWINCSGFYCAHIGLPALLALSVDDVVSTWNDGNEIIHPLVSDSEADRLPVIMARMLGNEMEPTIKVKLFNLCLEYSVPLILALTNMDQEMGATEVIAELSNSIAGLNLPRMNDQGSGVSNEASGVQKPMRVELLIHDSAIGLSPQKLAAKGLFVLADTHFSTTIPAKEDISATLDLRKVALFLTDERNSRDGGDFAIRSTAHNPATKPKLLIALSKQGFESVGSIMAAKAKIHATSNPNSEGKSITVDLSSRLILLETCADSTQTLIAVLSQLAPPTPPSKQPKYLTQPMTIDDMMASFTGDAFVEPGRPAEKLFDAEEDIEDSDAMMNTPMFDDDPEGLLADSEMSASLYGPIGGILDINDDATDDDTDDDRQIAESLLEDDPFEMPTSPTDNRTSDSALIRDLNRQAVRAANDDPVDLGLYEIEDLGFDALGGNQSVLGVDHRFNTPASAKPGLLKAKKKPHLPFVLKVRDLHVIWNIYDGYDWQRTRDGITQAVERVETKAEERRTRQRQLLHERDDNESVIGDFLFNSIYIGVPTSHDAQELRRQINRGIDDQATETESIPVSGMSKPSAYPASGTPSRQKRKRRLKLGRSKAHKIAFELKGLCADVIVFPPDSEDVVSSLDVRIRDFEIFDNVPTSTWRKFLTHMDNDRAGREMSKPMVHIELLNVRTLEHFAASEIALHVTVLPLRLHVDQDALDFITRFFEFKDKANDSADAPSDQPFLQRVEVDTVDMRLDYKPKKIDFAGLRSGRTTEFMNFVILDAADIRLKHAIIYGIKGFEPLHKTLNDVWMPDIRRNQLPTILAGLAPVRSLVNIGAGVRDVVAIPIREYRKDGRIVRSIQKGAFRFGQTTTSELARLGAKVAIGTQNLLQGAEGLLSPSSASPASRPGSARRYTTQMGRYDDEGEGSGDDEREQRAISAYADQPIGVLSGLRSARRHLERDLLTARDALIAVQGEILESEGPSGAAAAVAKHAPTILIRPVTGVSRAVGTALLGVGNQIDHSNLRRAEDKYKKR